MKKQILTAILLSAPLLGLWAQKGSWGEFPMVPNKSFDARASAASKIKTGPAYEKALHVYDRLREARGDFRYPVPAFYLTPSEVVAEIKYKENCIYLSEKAFNVCESFGAQSEAAIAFLLGHELTHYYEKHAWRGNFASENSNLIISRELDSLFTTMLGNNANNNQMRSQLMRFDMLVHQFEKVEREAQSDYLGGFLAYTAGYDAFEKTDELISRLYKAFELPDTMDGYVTRREREDLSRRSAQKMKDLVEVFEMANLLTAVGLYEDAYRYYRCVLVEYQSREVYNNVGATAMFQALKLFKEGELKYRYPVQLDLEMGNHRGDDQEKQRRNLLEQALLHFNAAISLDPAYAPAYLNKACALALLGDATRARFYADVEARAVSVGRYAGNVAQIEILLGILDAESQSADGTAKAKARFEAQLASDKTGLAAYNLSVLNKQAPPAAPEASLDFFEDEAIDGKSILTNLYPEEDKRLTLDETLSFHQYIGFTPNSRLYFNRRSGKMNVLFHATKPGYTGESSGGIKIGSSKADIEKSKKYGAPLRSIQTPTGQILAYPDVLFILKNDAVERWVLYKTRP